MGNKSTHSVGGARRGAGRETMMGAAECSGKTDGTRKWLLGHWVPFAVWVGVILLLQVAAMVWTLPRWIYPVSYAAKSLVCAALLLYFRPWRGQPGLRATDWALGLLAGVLVAVLWILPETPWAGRLWPGLQAFYYRWLVFPPGRFPSYLDPAIFPELPYNHPSLAYSPAEAGWVLAVLKLLGSAGVIAVIEEYFFRGFLYHWFRGVRLPAAGRIVFDAAAFWWVVVLFGLEHDRWLAGLLAGVVYGAVVIRTGRIAPAVVAHVSTNWLLGLYVFASGQYGFW